MRYKLKRLAISLIAMLLIITSLPISAIADTGIGDNDNTGGGSGSYSTGRQFTWTDNQSGYRFAIVVKNFNQVSNTVDIVFGITSIFSGRKDAFKPDGNQYAISIPKDLVISSNVIISG